MQQKTMKIYRMAKRQQNEVGEFVRYHVLNSIFPFFIFFFSLSAASAQQTITTTGLDASGSGGTVSFTVGQVLYTTFTGTNGSAAHGVQQPYEISEVIGLEEAKDISLEYEVYPNPAIEILKLKVRNYSKENLTIRLYDIKGKLLESKKVMDNETEIHVGQLLPAVYFLKISNQHETIKTFKIIKN